MYIKRVVISDMHNVKLAAYDLAHTNWITGPNGSGKSTVLQAIQLALLGYVPITGKTKGSVFQHMSSKLMQIQLVLDNNGQDVTITRHLKNANGKKTNEVIIDPEEFTLESIIGDLELPVFNMTEFLSMTANTQKDWFIKFLPSAGDANDVWSAIKNTIDESSDSANQLTDFMTTAQESWQDCVACAPDIVSALTKFNESLKSLRSFKQAEQKRLENTINSLIRYSDESADPTELSKLKEERSLQSKVRDSILQYQAKISMYETAMSVLKRYDESAKIPLESNDEYKEVCTQLNTVKESVLKVSDRLIAQTQNRDAYRATLNALQQFVDCAEGTCPFTKNTCATASSFIAEKQAEYQSTQVLYTMVVSSMESDEAELKELNATKANLESKKAHIEDAHNGYERARNACPECPQDPADGRTLDSVDAILQVIDQRIERISDNIQFAKLADSVTKEKFKVDLELEAIKSCITATGPNGIPSQLAEGPFTQLATNINSLTANIFADNRVPKFHLAETANSFSFGLQDTVTGEYIPFDLLSSGEKCALSVALMFEIVKMSSSPLKVVLIDDLFDHLDADRHRAVLNVAVNNPDVQLISAGVGTCTEECVNVIHLTR